METVEERHLSCVVKNYLILNLILLNTHINNYAYTITGKLNMHIKKKNKDKLNYFFKLLYINLWLLSHL